MYQTMGMSLFNGPSSYTPLYKKPQRGIKNGLWGWPLNKDKWFGTCYLPSYHPPTIVSVYGFSFYRRHWSHLSPLVSGIIEPIMLLTTINPFPSLFAAVGSVTLLFQYPCGNPVDVSNCLVVAPPVTSKKGKTVWSANWHFSAETISP